MNIEHLAIANFRLLRSASLELSPGANLLVGENAQGKTSVLEAIGYLASGRSFRAARDREAIRDDAGAEAIASIEGRFVSRAGRRLLRAAISHSQKALYLDGKPVPRLADLLGVLRAVTFVPADGELVRGAPSVRRAFADALLAQSSRADLLAMQSYARALGERNALLRAPSQAAPAVFAAFEASMAEHGARLMIARKALGIELAESVGEHLRVLAGGLEGLKLSVSPGVPADSAAAKALAADAGPDALAAAISAAWAATRAADRDRGSTLHGPHRADVALVLEGRDARAFASQGQARSIVLALRLAEVDILERRTGEPAILLLDDVFGELDRRRAGHFFHLLARRGTQAVITATDATAIEGQLPVGARFEVKAGVVRRA